MSLADLKHFLPFAIIGFCWLVGKWMHTSSKCPNWLIPIVLPLVGLASGAATAAALGGDWKAWLDSTLVGMISGASAVGAHQAARAMSQRSGGSSSPPAPSGAGGEGGASGPKPSMGAMHRAALSPYRAAWVPPRERLVGVRPLRLAWLVATLGVSLLSGSVGCASTASLVAVAQIVAVAAPYAIQVVSDVEGFLATYFAAHPDPAKAAALQTSLDRAKAAAAALGQLAAAGADVSQAQYVAAALAFEQAYADLMIAVQALLGVVVQTPQIPGAPVAVRILTKDSMVLIAPPPSAFHPKGL